MLGAKAQQNMISSITINMPTALPANTNDWENTLPPVSITAQSKLDSSRNLPADLVESRILLTIKSSGSIVCGEYTPKTAPMANFNSPIRNWRGADIEKLIGTKPCILKPGQYTLCVQFFNYEGKQLSEERCKPFTINGDVATSDEKFSSPQAITPADGKLFTEKESKTPLSFRWTPVVHKQKVKIKYTVRVIEIPKGQTGASVLKSSTPLLEKEVTDITQLTGINFNLGSYMIQKDSEYGWYVEATGADEKSYGQSGVNVFSVIQNNNPSSPAMVMSGANADFKIDSATCLQKENGQFKYHVWGHYTNMNTSTNSILLNDALNFPGYTANPNSGVGANLRNNIRIKTMVYNPSLSMNDILEASTGTISNISPLPASVLTPAFLAPNSSHNFQFDYNTATNAPVQFTYYGLVDDGLKFMPNKNTRNETDSLEFPKCPCSACDEVTITTAQQGEISNNGNGSLNLSATVFSSPKKVKRIRAELVYFDMKLDDEKCLICNKNSSYFGNFISAGIVNTNFTAAIPQPHSAQFDAVGNVNISSGVTLNFSVTIPPLVSCCNADVNFCIRYVITYEDCTVCNKLSCYNNKIKGCQK